MTRITPGTVKAFTAHRVQRLRSTVSRGLDPLRDRVDPDRTRYFPDDLDRLDGYRARFPATARVFRPFLRRCRDIRSAPDAAPVAVVVTPWFGTPGPWFAIALGLGLARRGRSVTFVWHDLPFPEPSTYVDMQNEEIGRALRTLRGRFPVLRLSDQPADAGAGPHDDDLLDDLTEQNLTWSLRGALEPEQHEEQRALRMRSSLAAALPRVRALVRRHGFRYAVVPGGVLLPTGLYMETCREAGIRAATYDAGLGWTAVCTDGVAAQQTDLTKAFPMLSDEVGGDTDGVVDAAREEFEQRRAGVDRTSYQQARTSNAPPATADAAPKSILIPLSVVFDTAALGRHHLFNDSREWLVETISALLHETDDRILIRQHPSERRKVERSRFDAASIVQETFGANPQVVFIAAEDPQNTYDLLDQSRLVLPFVSTIGIEAAALGKPVIAGGAAYYGSLGFVWAPSSRTEYFDVLARGARGELPLLPEQVDRAWRCYYLNAVCQRVWTDFTPQPPDFWRWVTRRPDDLYDDPAVDDILTAIDEDVPLPILRHRRRQGSPPAPRSMPSGPV